MSVGLSCASARRLLHRAHRAVDDGMNQRVQCAASEFVNVDVAIRQRETQRGGVSFRKLMLDRDQCLAQFLREFAVRREVDFVRLKDLFVDEGLQQVVDVVAAEVRVAVGRENLINVAFGGGNEFQDGDVERAAAEIINGDAAALLFVQAIRERGSGWLVNQAQELRGRQFCRRLWWLGAARH